MMGWQIWAPICWPVAEIFKTSKWLHIFSHENTDASPCLSLFLTHFCKRGCESSVWFGLRTAFFSVLLAVAPPAVHNVFHDPFSNWLQLSRIFIDFQLVGSSSLPQIWVYCSSAGAKKTFRNSDVQLIHRQGLMGRVFYFSFRRCHLLTSGV